MNDLTLICETCRFPIEGDTGAIYVTFADIRAVQAHEANRERGAVEVSSIDIVEHLLEPGPIRWRTSHYAHPGMDEDSYGITSDRITTWQHLAWWTAHLMEKNWFPLSNWDTLLREVCGESKPRRIRVAAREAA